MKVEDYRKGLKIIEAEYKKQKDDLAKTYALANNNINIGDVITDHIGSIKVESIKVEISSFYETPRCVYFGPELRKDKSPKKNGAKRNVWQSNLINQIPTDR